MPQVFLLAACAALLPLSGLAQAPAKPESPRSIGVFMDFESAPGAASVEIMKREVESLLKPSGVSLAWRLVRDNHGNEPFAGLVVLKFKGQCKAEGAYSVTDAFGSAGESETLASTKVDHGRVLPYSEVECDQVRQALSYLAPGAGQKERQRALGVAMGRVVAHELYHILAGTTTHAGKGLAKASHSFEDLVSTDKLSFTAEDARAITTGAR